MDKVCLFFRYYIIRDYCFHLCFYNQIQICYGIEQFLSCREMYHQMTREQTFFPCVIG